MCTDNNKLTTAPKKTEVQQESTKPTLKEVDENADMPLQDDDKQGSIIDAKRSDFNNLLGCGG